MHILYSHVGIKGKCGWGRTFYMAKGLVELGHSVTLLTINPQLSFLKIKNEYINGVKVVSFPDFFPLKIKSSGFAIWSTIFKCVYSLFHKYDLCIADCGHRFTAIPCKINRKIRKSLYFSEWWDFFGKGGYYEKKSTLFKATYGKIECYNELNDKRKADAVIVLSTFMRQRAIDNGISPNKIFIIPGGSIIHDVPSSPPNKNKSLKDTIKIAYIGVDNQEIKLLSPFIDALRNPNIQKKFKLVLYGDKISSEVWNKYDLTNIAEYRGYLNYSKDTTSLNDIDIFLQLLDDNNMSRAGWPNKLGDYLAFGKPIILAPYGDVEKFVENQKGFFLISYNKEAIINKLLNIENLSPSTLFDMGIENLNLAETISWKNRARLVINIVKQI